MSSLAPLTEAMRAFGSPKELARAGGVSCWTAVRYQRGETFPGVLTLTRLMAASGAIAEAVLRAAGLDDLSLDVEQARLVRTLAELEARRIARHDAVEQAVALARRSAGAARRTPPHQGREPPGAAHSTAAPTRGPER